MLQLRAFHEATSTSQLKAWARRDCAVTVENTNINVQLTRADCLGHSSGADIAASTDMGIFGWREPIRAEVMDVYKDVMQGQVCRAGGSRRDRFAEISDVAVKWRCWSYLSGMLMKSGRSTSIRSNCSDFRQGICVVVSGSPGR